MYKGTSALQTTSLRLNREWSESLLLKVVLCAVAANRFRTTLTSSVTTKMKALNLSCHGKATASAIITLNKRFFHGMRRVKRPSSPSKAITGKTCLPKLSENDCKQRPRTRLQLLWSKIAAFVTHFKGFIRSPLLTVRLSNSPDFGGIFPLGGNIPVSRRY